MPIRTIELDASTREDEVTLLIGKNIVLKLTEDEHAKRQLNQPSVLKLLQTENLFHKDFTNKMYHLIDLSSLPFQVTSRIPFRFSYRIHLRIRLSRKQRQRLDIRTLKRENRDFIKEIKKVDKDILSIESELKKSNKDLEVLQPTIIPLCNNCYSPLFSLPQISKHDIDEILNSLIILPREDFNTRLIKGEFKGNLTCVFCESLVTREKAIRIPFHLVIPSIKDVWDKGIWLEEFVATILRKMGWQTWTHIHMLGISGIPHEIDVLGIKKGFVLISECKTGKLKREDVFTFSTKVTDLKSHVALFFSLLQLPESETREFLQKNPMMVLLENCTELTKEQIDKEIKAGVIGKI